MVEDIKENVIISAHQSAKKGDRARYITIKSNEMFGISTYVGLSVGGKYKQFEVIDIKVTDEGYITECVEKNYNVFISDSFELRNFLGLMVTEINDKKIIEQIKRNERYC